MLKFKSLVGHVCFSHPVKYQVNFCFTKPVANFLLDILLAIFLPRMCKCLYHGNKVVAILEEECGWPFQYVSTTVFCAHDVLVSEFWSLNPPLIDPSINDTSGLVRFLIGPRKGKSPQYGYPPTIEPRIDSLFRPIEPAEILDQGSLRVGDYGIYTIWNHVFAFCLIYLRPVQPANDKYRDEGKEGNETSLSNLSLCSMMNSQFWANRPLISRRVIHIIPTLLGLKLRFC